MPPRDPKLCPSLERALPGDSGAFLEYRTDDAPWRFMFGDNERHLVSVRAWWTDRYGRSVVQVEWHIDGSTYEESYLAEPEKMREV